MNRGALLTSNERCDNGRLKRGRKGKCSSDSQDRPSDSALPAFRGRQLRGGRFGSFRYPHPWLRASRGGHRGECDRGGPACRFGGDLDGPSVHARNRSGHTDVCAARHAGWSVHDHHWRRTSHGTRHRLPRFDRGRSDLGPRRGETDAVGSEAVGMSRLDNKVALVTGSSRGIGAAIALLFAQNGAKVAVHGRDVAALSAVQQSIEGSGGRAIQVLADMTKFDEIEAMRRQIERELGPIQILVANAGGSYSPPGPLEATTEEGWHASVEGNLTATFLTIKSILPGMKERKAGNIITISSSAGRRPHPRSPIPYAAGKAGIDILTQDLAAQVGPYGIRVNCIAPETVLTERNRLWLSEDVQRSLIEAHPIRRLGTPDDIARAALFLASEEAGWITGVVLDVTGGAVMV